METLVFLCSQAPIETGFSTHLKIVLPDILSLKSDFWHLLSNMCLLSVIVRFVLLSFHDFLYIFLVTHLSPDWIVFQLYVDEHAQRRPAQAIL